MTRTGFFTRQDAREAGKRAKQKAAAGLPLDAIRRMGPKAVKNMNPAARSPEMPPSGAAKPLVCILGEAPDEKDDLAGTPFAGPAGQSLANQLPSWVRKKVKYDYICRTRPRKNLNPSVVQIEAFRGEVEESIAKHKPKAIIGVGALVLQWATGFNAIKAARGRRFPFKVKDHVCWFYPVVHPAWLHKIKKGRVDKIPGYEWAKYFEQDLERACDEADEIDPPELLSSEKEEVSRGIELFKGDSSPEKVRKSLKKFRKDELLALDLETQGLRPYGTESRILTVSVSNGHRTVSFGLDHDEVKDPKGMRKVLAWFLGLGHRIAAHNLGFELEWLIYQFEDQALQTKWEDSMAAGYILDCRSGGLSLEFLCVQEFGIKLKSLSVAAAWRNRLQEIKLDKLLYYNSLDSKYTALLMDRLLIRLENEELLDTYREHQLPRISACAKASIVGIPVNQARVKKLKAEYEKREDKVQKEIKTLPEVRIFEKRSGPFNPMSNKDLVTVFRDILGVEEGKKEGGQGYTTDDEMLSQIRDRIPLAAKIQELRNAHKLRGTYLDPMVQGAKGSVVWPDGLLHCQFKTANTDSGRLSSSDPNGQNWPKRKDRRIRSIIKPKKGYRILSVDFGQIEARVLGMASKDRAFCEALWKDYDIHMKWSERTVELEPRVYTIHGKDMKKVRTMIKNALVFPSFYGAQPAPIAKYIGISERKARILFGEFWDEFEDTAKWQKTQIAFYNRKGYTQGLTGRRRYGPLSSNMVLNTPIQGAASDIVIAAMIELSLAAVEMDMPWLQAVLNIHDDLTFVIPEERMEEAIEIIVGIMLEVRWDWINVPLAVEVEEGPDWFSMEEVGVFRSDEV